MADYSDDFNRADENPLSGGGDWTIASGYDNLQITSQEIRGSNAAAYSRAYWTGGPVSPNQACEFEYRSGTANFGIKCRYEDSSVDRYEIVGNAGSGVFKLRKSVATVLTDLWDSGGITWSAGDVARLEVIGNTCYVYLNGTLQASVQDYDLLDGVLAVSIYGDATYLDNFSGGDAVGISIQDAISYVLGTQYPRTVPYLLSDNFNRGDEDPLSGNWQSIILQGNLKVVSNQLRGSTAAIECAMRRTEVFGDNQVSGLTIQDVTDFIGPIINAQDGATDITCYGIKADSGAGNSLTMQRINDGSLGWSETANPTLSAGDVIEIRREGNYIRGYRNGGEVMSHYDASPLSGGSPGARMWATVPIGDDWYGGSVELVSITDAIAYSLISATLFERYISDVAGITDALSKLHASVRLVSDSMGTLDTISKITSFVRRISDSEGITDEAVRTQAFARILADSVGLTDEEKATAIVLRLLSDTVGITDEVSIQSLFSRLATDTVGLSDEVVRAATYAMILSDSVGISDEISTVASILRLLTESLGITDSSEAKRVLVRLLSESVGLTDSTARSVAYAAFLSDSISVTDSYSKAVQHARSLQESMGITDEIISTKVLFRYLSEEVGVSDALRILIVAVRTISEPFTVSDNLSTVHSIVRIISDDLSTTDEVSYTQGLFRILSDSMGLEDAIYYSLFVGGQTFLRYISEQITVLDPSIELEAIVRSIADVFGISDEQSVASAYARYLSESVGPTDTVSLTQALFRTLSESIGITDALAVTLFVYINRYISESVGVTDTDIQYATFFREARDVLGITDEELISSAYLRVISDSLPLSDSISKAQGHVRLQADDVGITDAATKLLFLLIYRTVTESMGIQDSSQVFKQVVRFITDNMGIADETDYSQAIVRIMTDIMGTSDSAGTAATMIRTIADSMGLSDAEMVTFWSGGVTYTRIITEVLGITDRNVAATAAVVWMMIALSLRRFLFLAVVAPFITLKVMGLEFAHVEATSPWTISEVVPPFIEIEAYKL